MRIRVCRHRYRVLCPLLVVAFGLTPSIAAAQPVAQVPAAVTDVTGSAKSTIIRDLWRDRPQDRPPAQCFKVWGSSLDRRWVMIDESKYAANHPQFCPRSDAWSYARKGASGWQFMRYAGSGVDTCSGRIKGLSREGMPQAVARELGRVYGCS